MSEIVKNFEKEGAKTIEHFKKELGRTRTGRANTAMLEGIVVDYYGAMVPLAQLGNVSAPEARLLTIQVYDGSAVEAIEKSILQSDLGLNPSHEGMLIRIIVPALNEERRKDLIKRLHKMGEENKVVLRNQRRDAIDVLKNQEKEKVISADDVRKRQDEIQKIIDRYTKDVDSLLAAKEKELMEV